ncbi:MAG: hypothetical protein COW34_08115 [Armatimonadetes bacterium CG17_big_fil_post_rev_8_21_14_2_50_66_6]|nr:MAG: hypothetical protein COW34_08115 [Armatimonadetes bacterium CG17_big_fil_post_rev_8_21_14_2_50_66_6]
MTDYDRWARNDFERRHPGEKPLNWRIAEVARRFHRQEPMGRFVLHQNDCSDFVACAVDEALGVQARFRRGSDKHLLGTRMELVDCWSWREGDAVQPGDVVNVRHSPWYPPNPNSIWHVGVVGPEGCVYDFVKLKTWKRARYGRNAFAWFVRHSGGPNEVEVCRLKARYRYRIDPVSGVGR